MSKKLAIFDLGGQYCHLISRRLRDLGVLSDIVQPDTPSSALTGYSGIILSGGPRSVYDATSPTVDPNILELGMPVLGICYGHQLLAKTVGATVERGASEFGLSKLALKEPNSIFDATPTRQNVWMSHSDSVTHMPKSFTVLASTKRCGIAAYGDFHRNFYGVQFHPEVDHTAYGQDILRNFSRKICGLKEHISTKEQISELISNIQRQVGDKSVFFLVSGGVDSTVAFTLCARALPRNRILGLYVDTGLMRKGETDELRSILSALKLEDRLKIWDASKQFQKALENAIEPEEKRHIIGRLFVEIQSEAMQAYGIDEGNWLLGQGTIYPDTIESGGSAGRAETIKTHHNRCKEIIDLIERGRVIEPLSEFYKDEVRQIGLELGLDSRLTNRWPFPGPGLAIRCLCARSKETKRAEKVSLPEKYSKYEGIHLPIRSVGVQGDGRTYSEVVAIRGPFQYRALQSISTTLCNIDSSHNRVVFAISELPNFYEATIKAGSLDADRLEILREADFVVRNIMYKKGLLDKVWQFPVVLIPLSFNGGESIVLRPVNSKDGMTANFAKLNSALLKEMAREIEEIKGIDAVFLDVTDKPPATIEWE